MALGDNGAAPPFSARVPQIVNFSETSKKNENENENVEGKKSVIKKRRRINLYTGKVSWVISITPWDECGGRTDLFVVVGGGEGCVVLADQRDEQFY